MPLPGTISLLLNRRKSTGDKPAVDKKAPVKKAVRSTPSKKELQFRSFFGQTFNDAKSGGE